MKAFTKILGTPGAGKTYTLMEKYDEFLDLGFDADEITCCTYRVQAAKDMRNKLSERTGVNPKHIKKRVNTIHSIGYRLLEKPEVISKTDINRFVKDYGYEPYTKQLEEVPDDDWPVHNGDLLNLYMWMKNTKTPIDKLYEYPGIENVPLPEEKIPDFIEDYEEYKKRINKIDFSDMIEKVLEYRIPLDTPVLLVDEFQDLTRQQYDLFQMWANSCEYVVIAGDPYQSIYGFWGGSPDYFNNWQAHEIVLDKSHRLPKPIWDMACDILKMEFQCPPEVEAIPVNYNPIEYLSWNDDYPIQDGTEFHLVRCNYQGYAVAKKMIENGRIFTGICGWDEGEIALFNAIKKARNSELLLKDDLTSLINYYPISLLNFTGSKREILQYLEESHSTALPDNEPIIGDKLYSILLSDDPSPPNCSELLTMKLKSQLSRNTTIDTNDLYQCQLLTIHGSKGLEADNVFVHNGIPKKIKKCIEIPGEEPAKAEARVWYVAVTRAKKKLYIIEDKGRVYDL